MYKLSQQEKLDVIGINMSFHHIFVACYKETIYGDSQIGWQMISSVLFRYSAEQRVLLKKIGIDISGMAQQAKKDVQSKRYIAAVNNSSSNINAMTVFDLTDEWLSILIEEAKEEC